MAGTKDYAVLDLQNETDSLGVDLQFQDFGDARTQSSGHGAHHEQTITFSDFPDTAEEELEQEKVGPKIKRCKFDDDAADANSDSSSLPLCPEKVQVTAVLPEGVMGVAALVQVAVLELKDRKFTSTAIKELSSKLPVPSLNHLKRVRKVSVADKTDVHDSRCGKKSDQDLLFVYLTYLEDFGIPDLVETSMDNLISLSELGSIKVRTQLEEKGIDVGLFTENVFASYVAKYAPRVRDMYDKVSPYWPCAFHKDLYLAHLSSGMLFSEDQLKCIVKFMNKALELGKTTNIENGESIGALIVNSASGSVVGCGQDRRHRHPVQHAAMVAIDCVAVNQKGGAWDIHGGMLRKASSGMLNSEGDSTTTCDELIIKVNENVSEKDANCLDNPKEDGKSEVISYICTGYDVYLTREPCMMCAMALLHSRVQRIFYRFPNPKAGALESRTKLHTLAGINHRFEAFTVLPSY